MESSFQKCGNHLSQGVGRSAAVAMIIMHENDIARLCSLQHVLGDLLGGRVRPIQRIYIPEHDIIILLSCQRVQFLIPVSLRRAKQLGTGVGHLLNCSLALRELLTQNRAAIIFIRANVVIRVVSDLMSSLCYAPCGIGIIKNIFTHEKEGAVDPIFFKHIKDF